MMECNFVSAGTLDAKTKKRKAYYEDQLQKAKDGYEASKRKRDLEEGRGDKEWMLASLSSKIKEDSEKSKKTKKKKKHKKKVKKKHKHDKNESDSSSNEQISSDEWEESSTSHQSKTSEEFSKKTTPADSATYLNKTETSGLMRKTTSTTNETQRIIEEVKINEKIDESAPVRDEWMMSTSMFDIAAGSTTSRVVNKTKQRKEEKRRQEEDERKKLQSSRELNPYWKNGGSGLPEDEISSKINIETKTKAESTEGVRIGDGGRSWIEKAYERAVQQSKDEGIPLEKIVEERWGSMDKLNALRRASKENRPSSHSSGWRKKATTSEGWRKKDAVSENLHGKTEHNDNLISQETKKVPLESHYSKTSPTESNHSKPPLQQSPHSKPPLTSSSSSDSEGEVVSKVLSEKEKNDLSAKIIRAELMGNEDLVEKLKNQLNAPTQIMKKHRNKKQKKVESSSEEENAEILMRPDKHGNLYPIKLKSSVEQLNEKQRRRKKIVSTHDEDGKRVRYFEDDDHMNLKSMVEEERLTSADDHLAMLSTLASKHLGKTQGDDYTLDDMFVQASATKGSNRVEEKRVKEKAVAEHKQREAQLSNCRFCFDSPKISKHLIISIGTQAYLALPINASLTEGHCLILPMSHVIGQTFFDEDMTAEVKQFKNCLTSMFRDKEEDVIFLETCKNIRHQNHCVIECIPVDKEIGDMAPIYFKKALMECESEWADNKKVVEVKSNGGVAKAVPKGLSYFSVEFALDGGYAHVLEDETTFQNYFGKEIIGGMMDIEPRMWRKPPKETFEKHKKKILKFSEQWKKYDFTH